MWLIYLIVKDFGWAVIIFTLLVKTASFPLSLKQQKNMAVSQLFTPRVQEIQRKYRGNQAKMQEEMQKLQKEGYNPMGGCGPMILTMIILFGVLDVVYKPMTHMERFDKEIITEAVNLSKEAEFTSIILSSGKDYQLFMEFAESGEDFRTFFTVTEAEEENAGDDTSGEADTEEEINTPDVVTDGLRRQIGAVVLTNLDLITARTSNLRLSSDVTNLISRANGRYVGLRQELIAVSQFSRSPDAFEPLRTVPARASGNATAYERLYEIQENMVFLGFIDLALTPDYRVFNSLWIIAFLCFGFSVVQVLVQRRIQKETMPNMPNSGMMRNMMFIGPAFALMIVFLFPAGAGLYWAISNVFMIAQSIIIFKFWPPEQMRQEAKDKVQASLGSGAVTATATVVDVDDEGNEVKIETKISDMSKREQEEHFKKKLEAARKADLEKYGDESELTVDKPDNGDNR
ncbi:MAG: membrane protein insertase YidC [Oscillospiraceae bacterium]|jgi:YidC/Oxa1 family membrane protein insertase|nr:membrane protein insertase YidC [Oscillospiraceae bacterium]